MNNGTNTSHIADRPCAPDDALRHDPLLTAQNAAAILGVTPHHLVTHRAAKFSSIKVVRVNNAIRFRTSDVLRLAATTTGQSAPGLLAFNDDVLLNLQDAATYLAFAPSTLAYWLSRNAPAGPVRLKVGRCVRYRLSELNRWVDHHAA